MNCSNSHLRSVLWPNLPWTVIFLAALWVIWKARNALIFEKKKLPMNIILFFVRELAYDFQGIFFKNHGGSEKVIDPSSSGSPKWEKPYRGWIKLNTDASVFGVDQAAAIGGVARDSNGHWLWGFSKSIGKSDVDKAELHALIYGLSRAWEMRIQKIVVEIDSANVFYWITNPIEPSHHLFQLIEDFKWLSGRPWQFNLQLIRRSANACADKLAKLGHQARDIVLFDAPPWEDLV